MKLCTIAVLLVLFIVAEATHFRYGTISWFPTGTRVATIKVQQAYRRSFFGAPGLGATFVPGSLCFGDGGCVNLNLVATSVDLVNDILAGEATLVHTYPNNGPFTITQENCCRLSPPLHQNNGDQNWRNFAVVNFNFAGNRSPVANVLPIVVVPRAPNAGAQSCFQIAAVDPDGDPLTFSLVSPAANWGAATLVHPPGSSVSATGLYCWANNGLTNMVGAVWSTAVRISDGKSETDVDWFLSIGAISFNNQNPNWVRPPTPADGAVFTQSAGTTISFTVQCLDPDNGQSVFINSGALPAGSSLSVQAGSNPGSRTFSWSSAVGATAVVCFSCSDSFSPAGNAPQTCATLQFTQTCCQANTQPPTLTGVPASVTLECGSPIPGVPTVTGQGPCDSGPTTLTPSVSDVGGFCNRVITRTWSYTDFCGRSNTASQTITIRDTTAPSLNVPAGQTVQCPGSTDPSATGFATAIDTCDSTPTVSRNDVTFPSNCLPVGRIQRTWTASDDCGNTASGIQNINIVDTVAPSLVIPPNRILECNVDSTAPASTGFATASDACDGSVTPTFSDSVVTNGCNALQTISRTWSVTDDCGNTASGVQTLVVRDTLAPTTSADPVCIFPPNGLYYCFDYTNPDFIHYSDACSATTIDYNFDCQDSTGSSSGCSLQGNQLCVKATTDHVNDNFYSFSFTVTDACGHSTVQSATIDVPNSDSGNCRTPTRCIPDCPEGECSPSQLDLIAEDGTVVGIVLLSNKLDFELEVEVRTIEGTIPDRGWWFTGLAIVVGNVRVEKSWHNNDAQSRWFATVNLNNAFPSGGHECWDSIPVFVAVWVTNDKRAQNPPFQRAFLTHPPAKRTGNSLNFPLPSDITPYTVSYTLCCECTIRTQTQNDYGNLCVVNNPTPTRTSQSSRVRDIACYLYNFWTWSEAWCFPNGLVIGCTAGHTATWTNPVAAASYWADESTPGVLTQDWVDPPNRALGYLAGETAALALNVRFDECDADWSTSCNRLSDLRVCEHPQSNHPECQPWWGSTVGQILAEANSVVGGCSTGNVNQLWQCVRYINRAFVDGKRLWEAEDFVTTATCPAPCKRTGNC